MNPNSIGREAMGFVSLRHGFFHASRIESTAEKCHDGDGEEEDPTADQAELHE
jgi:hypothetical protein